MALKGADIVTGLAIGVGVGLLAPIVMPILRPFGRSVLKAGLAAYDQAKVAAAELNERTGDVLSEVRAEIEEEQRVAGTQARSTES
jgi:Protein of unknown function (DUF5132)